MYTVGLVGPIGAGKSVVADAFAELGAVVLRADDASRELLSGQTCLLLTVRRELGDDIFKSNGQLDRNKTAELIFRDADARRRLEKILHPRMVEWLKERLEQLRSSPDPPPMTVVEAAILTHMGGRCLVDEIVRVTAPEDVCRRRIMQRDGITAKQAQRRIAVHRELGLSDEAADYVLQTTGSIDETRAKSKKLARRMLDKPRNCNDIQ